MLINKTDTMACGFWLFGKLGFFLIMKGLCIAVDCLYFPLSWWLTSGSITVLWALGHTGFCHHLPSSPSSSLIPKFQEPSKEKSFLRKQDSGPPDGDLLGLPVQGDSGRVWGLPGLQARRSSVLKTMKLAPGEPWESRGEECFQGGWTG